MRNFKQVYHHYTKLEEYRFGMWNTILGQEREKLLIKAIEFTGNAKLYGKYMMQAIDKWPYSCEQNLTCQGMNKQAWIGHAACCIAIGCPEDITRLAWRMLAKQQQDEANTMADKAIAEWEKRYVIKLSKKSRQLCLFGDMPCQNIISGLMY